MSFNESYTKSVGNLNIDLLMQEISNEVKNLPIIYYDNLESLDDIPVIDIQRNTVQSPFYL
jgi:hypothetical protein